MELWRRQLIRFLFPYSASKLDIEAALAAKNPHVPAQLYKYRSFSTDHLDALHRRILWMSSPDKFNDPYDSAIYFNLDRFLVENRSPQEMIAVAKKTEEINKSGIPFRPERTKRPIQQRAWRQKIADELLQHKSPDVCDALIKAMDDYQAHQNKEMVQQMTTKLREGFSALSLTENPLSVLMWSHYSDKHRGFCIEYDFNALPDKDLRKRCCFPVFYRRKLTDATRYLAKTDMKEFNNLFGQFQCLLKSDEWAYEKEWRIVYAPGPARANFELKMPKPSAIILGTHVRKDDIDRMTDYCRKKGISLKRATQRHDEFRLEIIDLKE